MTTVCATCGASLASGDLLYDEQGNVTCQRCLLSSQARDAKQRSAGKIAGIAYGAPVLGIGSFVFNPILLLSIAAIGNGLFVLRAMKRPDVPEGGKRPVEKAKVAALAGISLGAVSGILTLIGWLQPA
jgi:hypothetical protein